jgi:uncharacterized protein
MTQIPRVLAAKLKSLASSFPVIALIGPRQSGKSTLVKAVFPGKPYASLEPLDVRAFAQSDPRRFLAQFPEGAILDEVQRVPDLFSYLQGNVDEQNRPGRFILTGSQHFLLMESISQTLAGRIALLELFPFALEEIPSEKRPGTLDRLIHTGGYPRLYDQPVTPQDWHPSYLQTYVERDVRQLKNVSDLETFRRFLTLCAGRTGQILNYSSLAADAGISHPTAMAWIGLLETSFVIHLLRPHFANFNKRLIKMPKLHFVDTGLACSLLGIQDASQLARHPLRGSLFETWVVSELLKQRLHRGHRSNLFYWRDKTGHEIDILVDLGTDLLPIEVKSGQTFAADMLDDLRYWQRLAGEKSARPVLLYGGHSKQEHSGVQILGWQSLAEPLLEHPA